MFQDLRTTAKIGGEAEVSVVDLQSHEIVGGDSPEFLAGSHFVAQVSQETVGIRRAEEERQLVGMVAILL